MSPGHDSPSHGPIVGCGVVGVYDGSIVVGCCVGLFPGDTDGCRVVGATVGCEDCSGVATSVGLELCSAAAGMDRVGDSVDDEEVSIVADVGASDIGAGLDGGSSATSSSVSWIGTGLASVAVSDSLSICSVSVSVFVKVTVSTPAYCSQ